MSSYAPGEQLEVRPIAVVSAVEQVEGVLFPRFRHCAGDRPCRNPAQVGETPQTGQVEALDEVLQDLPLGNDMPCVSGPPVSWPR